MLPVYEPYFTEEDAQAAYSVVKSGILSAFGPEVQKLESNFASYIGTKHALSCSSGTTGLFLALIPFIKSGDVIVVPTGSYAATAFAAVHHYAKIRFVDSDVDTWNIDLDTLEEICKSEPIKAVIAVHNYGNPINMDRLMGLSNKYNFYVVEDACEALTSEYKGSKLGTIGHVGVFSFYGNKFITSGEGGMVVTNNNDYYNIMKLWRGQGQDPHKRFHHLVSGWNFRLTNLQAGILNSQFPRIDQTIRWKLDVKEHYSDKLDSDLVWQQVPDGGKNCYWMISIRHWEPGWYNKAEKHLTNKGIETRPIFPPIHKMPAMPEYNHLTYPNAEHINDTGITLPSGPTLTDEQIDYVCAAVNEIV